MYRNATGPTAAQITVGIGSFDELTAAGLRAFVTGDPALRLLRGELGLERLRETADSPRVAILGIAALLGVGDLYRLSRRWPDTSILVLADDPIGIDVGQLLSAGASACLPLRITRRALLNAIDQSLRGYAVLPLPQDPAIPSVEAFEFLTTREFEVCRMMGSGMTNAQIARSLHVSLETVKSHAKQVLGKLGVSSRRQLDDFAAQVRRERVNGGVSTHAFARPPDAAPMPIRRPGRPPRATRDGVSRRLPSFIS